MGGFGISFAPEVEAHLQRLATETGKKTDQIVQELVAAHLGHDEWFRQQVGNGVASLDSGKSFSHEEVRQRMKQNLRS